jgi:hypothetical protein
MKIALVIRGHFRTFDKLEKNLKDSLEGCDYDCFFHTWDTVDAVNQTWYRRHIIDPPKLDASQIDMLKRWDPNIVIESQEFTPDDHKQIYASWSPYKATVYRMNAFLKTLKRIDVSKYDMIIIGRYDIYLHNVKFKDVIVTPGQIELGARDCKTTILRELADTSEICAFHPSDLIKFYNPLDNTDPTKYTNTEEWYTEIFDKSFDKINIRWVSQKDFTLIRLGQQELVSDNHKQIYSKYLEYLSTLSLSPYSFS